MELGSPLAYHGCRHRTDFLTPVGSSRPKDTEDLTAPGYPTCLRPRTLVNSLPRTKSLVRGMTPLRDTRVEVEGLVVVSLRQDARRLRGAQAVMTQESE